MARLVQPGGAIVAFEPQRAIFDILCANLRLNALGNVSAFRRAVGSATGAIRVPPLDYQRPDNFGGVALGGASGEEVQLVTIDSLGLPRLRLLKVDVEGMEQAVITGARATLARLKPAVYVENDRAEHSRALISQLFDIGYRLWWHITPLFNPNNFFGNARDIFGDVVSFNMIGFPRADAPSLAYPEILSPDDFAGQPGALRR
jgi:FkbM family methyltransferase